MKKIIIILIVIIFSFAGLKAKDSTQDYDNPICGVPYGHYLWIQVKSNYYSNVNWSNGFTIGLGLDYLNGYYFEFNLQSTRLGSSMFTGKNKQDFLYLGISNEKYDIQYSDIYFFGEFNIGLFNSVNKSSINFILAPELGILHKWVNLRFGYNVFNDNNYKNQLAPFYISAAFTLYIFNIN